MPDEDYIKLTVKEFLDKYPGAGLNEQHLQDWACSNCGNRDCFIVWITTQMELTDNGVAEQIGDNEFSNDASHLVRCNECDAESPEEDFIIDGLDDAIDEAI